MAGLQRHSSTLILLKNVGRREEEKESLSSNITTGNYTREREGYQDIEIRCSLRQLAAVNDLDDTGGFPRIGADALYLLNHIESVCHLTEDSVLAV